jgi:uncharacterized membrane protein
MARGLSEPPGMSENVGAVAAVRTLPQTESLARQVTWWALVFPAIMVVALALHSVRLLNWIHVLSGVLWTGADIFFGFILGPVIRRLEPPQRTALIAYLVPKTLLYFPAVSLTTGTAGWYLAAWLGLTSPANAQFAWIVGALVLITLMTIMGLVIILPNSLRIWFELRKPEPDRTLIIRLNRNNIVNAAIQGAMQIMIIVVMAHLVMG